MDTYWRLGWAEPPPLSVVVIAKLPSSYWQLDSVIHSHEEIATRDGHHTVDEVFEYSHPAACMIELGNEFSLLAAHQRADQLWKCYRVEASPSVIIDLVAGLKW